MVEVQHCILGIDPGSRLTGYGLIAINAVSYTHLTLPTIYSV